MPKFACKCGNVSVAKTLPSGVEVRCSKCGAAVAPLAETDVRVDFYLSLELLTQLDRVRGDVPRAAFLRGLVAKACAK